MTEDCDRYICRRVLVPRISLSKYAAYTNHSRPSMVWSRVYIRRRCNRNARPEGHSIWLGSHAGPLYDPRTSTLHFVDISEKRVCMQLATMRKLNLKYSGFPSQHSQFWSPSWTIRRVCDMSGLAKRPSRGEYFVKYLISDSICAWSWLVRPRKGLRYLTGTLP